MTPTPALAIDDQRIYAAGFSGGARAASGMGKLLTFGRGTDQVEVACQESGYISKFR